MDTQKGLMQYGSARQHKQTATENVTIPLSIYTDLIETRVKYEHLQHEYTELQKMLAALTESFNNLLDAHESNDEAMDALVESNAKLIAMHNQS